MMNKDIFLSTRAQKEFNKLPVTIRERLKKALRTLASGSRQGDIKKLKGIRGRENLYRLRVGDYRITFYPGPDYIKVIRITTVVKDIAG